MAACVSRHARPERGEAIDFAHVLGDSLAVGRQVPDR